MFIGLRGPAPCLWTSINQTNEFTGYWPESYKNQLTFPHLDLIRDASTPIAHPSPAETLHDHQPVRARSVRTGNTRRCGKG